MEHSDIAVLNVDEHLDVHLIHHSFESTFQKKRLLRYANFSQRRMDFVPSRESEVIILIRYEQLQMQLQNTARNSMSISSMNSNLLQLKLMKCGVLLKKR